MVVMTITVSPGSMVSEPLGMMIFPPRLIDAIRRLRRRRSVDSGVPQTGEPSATWNSSASTLPPTSL